MPIKKAYISNDIVEHYNDRHFGGEGGKYVFERELSIINGLLGERTSGTLLDIPCGTGVFLEQFSNHGYQVTGADISVRMLEKTRSNTSSANFIVCDVNHLPLRSQYFDVILMIRLLQHMPLSKTRLIFNELGSILKPNGIIIFDTRSWSPRARNSESTTGIHVYTPNNIKNIIIDSGLIPVRSESAFLFSTLLYRKLSKKVITFLHGLEKLSPKSFLLKTYWACTTNESGIMHSV